MLTENRDRTPLAQEGRPPCGVSRIVCRFPRNTDVAIKRRTRDLESLADIVQRDRLVLVLAWARSTTGWSIHSGIAGAVTSSTIPRVTHGRIIRSVSPTVVFRESRIRLEFLRSFTLPAATDWLVHATSTVTCTSRECCGMNINGETQTKSALGDHDVREKLPDLASEVGQ